MANHIYLVVDRDCYTFRQKCHDVDCKYFSSPPFKIPQWLLESQEEAEFWDSLANCQELKEIEQQHSGKEDAQARIKEEVK